MSALAATILKTCFGTGRDFTMLRGTNDILRTLVKGSTAEVKKVVNRYNKSRDTATISTYR